MAEIKSYETMIEPVDRREELKAKYAEKCMKACEGLPDGALDGGWTASGMSAYARKLEDALNKIVCLGTERIEDAYVIAGDALGGRFVKDKRASNNGD